LTAPQIRALTDTLQQEASIPHGGPWGQVARRVGDGRLKLQGWLYPDQRVDVLNRAYAFTRGHLDRFELLAEHLGYSDYAAIGPIDDVLLSFAGHGRPICHDLGPWESCNTSNTDGIAVWREPGFAEARVAAYLKLCDFCGAWL
jgi:hypothetical protein